MTHRLPISSETRLACASRCVAVCSVTFAAAFVMVACGGGSSDNGSASRRDELGAKGKETALAAQGKHIFRFETFGDEAKWTDLLRMHEVISASVDPVTALSVGLKVDADALPAAVVQGIRSGRVDLHSPATTIALLKLDAVVGLKGTVETVRGVDRLTRVGITCALCHSTVDNSFAPGIGKRLDGWANRDLNVGAVIALSPALDAATKLVFNSWGPGKYDPRFNIDGVNKPVVIPPAYGLAGIHSITFTGDGEEIAYWNRYVAVTQMGGQGTFTEPRLNLSITNGTQDLVSSKLPALQAYQLSLSAPSAPPGSFDAAAAGRGKAVFETRGKCVTCHSGASFTDANLTLHPPSASMAEPESPSYAARSATKLYRTSPLRGVWQHAPYFHDGSAATLEDVGRIYNTKRSLGLSSDDISDLAQYLKSL
ncbi:c-type cytochrome [Aquincola sp. S2]|uniref:C-type cytochrome n=1 Tax=Pseudaquabacterium terrae TaxID=2732868 RepID=A0ABX2E9L2_9BURK|nr:c-type cytochrome [Aquabacterium terrae]NRF65691.1 c-type cytochrome [Aquabacterium terrae]